MTFYDDSSNNGHLHVLAAAQCVHSFVRNTDLSRYVLYHDDRGENWVKINFSCKYDQYEACVVFDLARHAPSTSLGDHENQQT